MPKPKTLKQILISKAREQSGGCWMIDFEPLIINAVKEWLTQKREESILFQKEYDFDPIVPTVNIDELLEELGAS